MSAVTTDDYFLEFDDAEMQAALEAMYEAQSRLSDVKQEQNTGNADQEDAESERTCPADIPVACDDAGDGVLFREAFPVDPTAEATSTNPCTPSVLGTDADAAPTDEPPVTPLHRGSREHIICFLNVFETSTMGSLGFCQNCAGGSVSDLWSFPAKSIELQLF